MIKIKKEFVLDVIVILIFTILGSYAINGRLTAMQPLAVIFLLAFLLFGSYKDNFGLLIMLIPFNNTLILMGVSIRGIFYFIAAIKIIAFTRKKAVGILLCPTYILLGIEAINDFYYTDVFSTFNNVSAILYFSVFILYKIYSEIDIYKLCNKFISSCLIALICSLIAGGGIQAYNNTIDYYRFGQEASSLGGAMGIPIYTGLIIAIALERIFNQSGNQWINILLVSFCLLLGIMTVSRIFLLILGVVILFIVIENFHLKTLKVLGIQLLGLVAIFILYFRFQDLILNLIMKFTVRIGGGESARVEIYKECINYLLSNIKALLIGEGSIGYTIIGQQKGYGFSAMAHNIYLDALMSWGIVGFSCLFILVLYLIRNNFMIEQVKKNVFLILPASIYFIATLTEGSFNYANTYIYILFVVSYIRLGISKRNNEGPTYFLEGKKYG